MLPTINCKRASPHVLSGDPAGLGGFSRRTMLGAGAALLVPSPVAARAVFEPHVVDLVNLVNQCDADGLVRWLGVHLSCEGQARFAPKVVAGWLLTAIARSGTWRLVGMNEDDRHLRLTVAVPSHDRPCQIDLIRDRRAANRFLELRPVLEPSSYPGVISAESNASRLRQVIARRVAYAADVGFSGSIIVVDELGQIVHASANGVADVVAKTPITLDTRFNLGSSDKSFTAVLIAQLVEDGHLDFDTAAGAILPELRATPLSKRTIAQLLTHSGGLGSPDGGILAYSHDQYATVRALLPALAAVPPLFAAGSRHAYSNEGYVLLGAVIEGVTGRPFWEVLDERIYRPCGMTRSGQYARDGLPGDVAKGYFRPREDLLQTGPLSPNDALLPWRGNSCGGGYSTAIDAARWLDAFRSGRLVSLAMRDRITAFSGRPYPTMAYGMGFVRHVANGKLWIGHAGGGGLSGIGSAMATSLETGWTVAILSNRDVFASEALLRDLMLLVPAR